MATNRIQQVGNNEQVKAPTVEELLKMVNSLQGQIVQSKTRVPKAPLKKRGGMVKQYGPFTIHEKEYEGETAYSVSINGYSMKFSRQEMILEAAGENPEDALACADELKKLKG